MAKLFVLPRLRSFVQTAACAAVVGPLSGAVFAQQLAPSPVVPAQQPTLNLDLHAALSAPVNLPGAPGSSSSSTDDGAAMATASFAGDPGGGAAAQPPPYRRRRYGRPSYSDRFHNADGSNRLAFVVGGGFNLPVTDQSTDYMKTSWRFEGGAGINFSRKLAVLTQFDWDQFGLPGSVLTNQRNLYSAIFVDQDGNPVDFSGLDGNSHIWSFTLNPTLTFYQTEKVGAYAVVGGGFYHKVTNFTIPAIGVAYDYYYGPYQYQTNQNFDTYTSNAPGVTGGIGVTYQFSRFSSTKFFAEARYVHTFNKVRYGDPSLTNNPAGAPNNLYPPNSNETSYIPITFGVRF